MNIQNVLDQTALIAGGALLSAERHVFKGAGGIAGVKIAYSLPPEQASLTEDGPAHVSFWDGMEAEGGAGDLTTYRHRVRMQLTLAIGRSELPRAYGLLLPFVPLYLAAFGAKLKLNGAVATSWLGASPGIVDSIYPDRLALEFILTAVEKEATSYAA